VIELRRTDAAPLRIAHRGAAALGPENTLEALERAVEHELDLVEIDVLETHAGELVLAHPAGFVARRRNPGDAPPATLDEALAVVAGRGPRLGVQLDLKAPGFEAAAVEALRRHGLLARAVVSSYFHRTLAAVADLEPALPVALTYPQDRLGVGQRRLLLPAVGGALLALRRLLPYRLDRWLARTGAAAAALHWAVLSRAAIERCHARGAGAIAWTVDDPRIARRLIRAGVDGIITNDPRIFEGLSTT
jgi:glycerophosphoryl diester phosphodiesterase